MSLDPSRTVTELRELQELTGDENGAQRVAWTDTWVRAREWLGEKLAGLALELAEDEAANQWWTLRGDSDHAVLIGGHIDSVPNGGWLDGALNVVAGVEVLRRLAEEGRPAAAVRLVNWADEEGARFGRSLFGSSAAAGSMTDQDELRERRDADGNALPEVVGRHGGDLDRAADVGGEWARSRSVEPGRCDEGVIGLADEAVREVAGGSHRLPSGPLHDAAEASRAGVPTVMLFVQSLRGLSHTKLEDTKPEHLELSVQALDRLASKTLDWVAASA